MATKRILERQTQSSSSLGIIIPCGTRYQLGAKEQGIASFLFNQAFKATNTASRTKIAREADLLGGRLSASLTRDSLCITAQFQDQDAHHFSSLLADIYRGFTTRDSKPNGIYSSEFVRKARDYMDSDNERQKPSTHQFLLDSVYSLAYRGNGLANRLFSQRQIKDIESVYSFIDRNFAVENINIVGFGGGASKTSELVELLNFKQGQKSLKAESPAIFRGNKSVHHDEVFGDDRVHLLVAFDAAHPFGTGSVKGTRYVANVLKHLLTEKPYEAIKLTYCVDSSANSFHIIHSDASVLGVHFTSDCADDINRQVQSSYARLKTIASSGVSGLNSEIDELARAKLLAKMDLAKDDRASVLGYLIDEGLNGENVYSAQKSLELVDQVSASQIQTLAKHMINQGPVLASVGNPFDLISDHDLSGKK